MIAAAASEKDHRREVMVAKRGLLLRDSLTFFALLAIAGTLFGITLFLFRSFESHREELSQRWAQRGQAALTAHHPADAIVALRAALSYSPDNESDQLLLAQALAESGHTDEAASYYLNRWEARPGDGFVNLQLARLARQKGDSQQAIEFYRASIFGDWGSDGVVRRRQVRMELSDYLTERKDFAAARAELLIGAGNAPDRPGTDLVYADKLQAAGDLGDAMTYYQKAIADDPHNPDALEKAGRIAFTLGSYSHARNLLDRALKYLQPDHTDASASSAGNSTASSAASPAGGAAHPAGQPGAQGAGQPGSQAMAERQQALATMARNADRLEELSLSRELPARQRADHLFAASAIAQKRLVTCLVQLGVDPAAATGNPGSATSGGAAPAQAQPASAAVQLPISLQALRARWQQAGSAASRRGLSADAAAQDGMTQLIFDTEQKTAAACGAPAGDDALLLQMASRPLTPDAGRSN